jgi:hypothetical protein
MAKRKYLNTMAKTGLARRSLQPTKERRSSHYLTGGFRREHCGENLFVVLLVMAPSQELQPPAIPERFSAKALLLLSVNSFGARNWSKTRLERSYNECLNE